MIFVKSSISLIVCSTLLFGKITYAEEWPEHQILDIFGDRAPTLSDHPSNVRPKLINKATLECLELIALDKPPSFQGVPAETLELIALACEDDFYKQITKAGYENDVSIDDLRSETLYHQVVLQSGIQKKNLGVWETELKRSEGRKILAIRSLEVGRLLDAFNALVLPIRETCVKTHDAFQQLKLKNANHREIAVGIPGICSDEMLFYAEEQALAAIGVRLVALNNSSALIDPGEVPLTPKLDMQLVRNTAQRLNSRAGAINAALNGDP